MIGGLMWMTFSPSAVATGGVAAAGASGAAAAGAAGSGAFWAGGCGARIREMGGRTGARASPVAPVPFRSGFSSINETDSGRAGGGVVGVEAGLGAAGTGAGVEGAGFGSGALSRGTRILLIGGTPVRTGLDSAAGAFFLGEMRSVATVRSVRSAGLGGTGASGLFLIVLDSFLELLARVAMNGFW